MIVRPARILLVDDNPANLKVLFETLDGRGYRLLVADSGDKALRIAQKDVPDLVLLDIMMPGLNGYEVCEQLKRDARTASAAVIFLSALDDLDAKIKGFDSGGADYVSKPFQVREVLARVENQLKIRTLERTLEARNRELAADKSSILGAMTEGVYGLDRNRRIVFANTAAAQIAGLPENELLQADFTALHFSRKSGDSAESSPFEAEPDPGPFGFDPARLDEECERVMRALSSGARLPARRAWFIDSEGTPVPVRYSLTPMHVPGHTTRAVVVFQDICEELEKEQELERTRAHLESQRSQLAHVTRLGMMGEMAAGIAHEVNQPLTAIVNYSRVAMRVLERLQSVSGEQEVLRETLGKIQTQSERASQVIQHIRNFVRKPAAGKIRRPAGVLAAEIRDLAEIEAKEQRVRFQTVWQENLPEIHAEPVQIQQVALNLIRNAMEAASSHAGPHGRARVWFTVEHRAAQRCVCFIVEDNGPGVPESARHQVFQPFFTTKKTGMGIGLTLCQSIVHSHQGEIHYEPASKHDSAQQPALETAATGPATGRTGSRFWFCLPVAEDVEENEGRAQD